MPRHAWFVFAGLALAGCDNEFEYTGFKMTDFFPLDGSERSLTYSNKVDLDYNLLTEMMVAEPDVLGDGRRVVTFSTSKVCHEGVEECGAGWVYDFYLSADDSGGIQLHGYERADGDGRVDFDAPLLLAAVRMAPGDVDRSTGVDGHDWTTTFAGGNEECEDTLNVDWSCALLTLESDPPGHWLAGSWWAAAGYNLVSFERTDDPGRWITSDWSYEP
jgi:hypothetical protein